MVGIKTGGAKPGKKGKKGGPKPVLVVGSVGVGPRSRVLDKAAADYARLLSDPCNARIVPPVYPGSDSGFLFRADAFGGIGIVAGQTAGIIHWTPGFVNANNTEFLVAGALDGVTASTATASIASPGKSFLTSNTRAVRCVAACLKITFPGAESARSGRIHYGLTQAGLIDSGQSVTADAVAQALTNYSRTPADTIELIWKPSIADTEFNDPTEASVASIRDRKAALTVAFAGLPAAVGVTYHATAVYEWQPTTGLGVSANPTGKADSRNTLDDVVDFMISRGETFTRNVGHQFMGGAMNAAMAGVSAVFGNMGASAARRIAY